MVTFSYFTSRKPTVQELNDNDDIYLLTPDNFDPHNIAYANNEDQMFDWQGDLSNQRNRKLLLKDITEPIASIVIAAMKETVVDDLLLPDPVEHGAGEVHNFWTYQRVAIKFKMS